MSDVAQGSGHTGLKRNFRDNGDGTFAEEYGSQLRAWDPVSLTWVKLLSDHATGNLNVSGGGTGGGGAATIADGADVAQGTTTDVAWVSGAGTVIALLKKIASAGGSAVSVADGADVAQGTTTDLSSANTIVGILKAIKAAITGTLTVSGPLTDTQLRATRVPVDASGVAVPVTDNAGTLTVDAPVGTPLWVRESDGAAAFVGQKAMAASKPVVIASDQSAIPVTDNSGTLTVDAPVGTPVFTRLSDGAAALIGQKVMASSLPVAIASDQGALAFMQTATGGANVLKTGTAATSATTVDQVVLTYTVTAAKTFYLAYLVMYGRLTTPAATASVLGAISLETPSGTKVITLDDINPTTSEVEFNPITFSQPIPIAAGVVVRVVVTPAAATAMTWRANFGGYEK